MAYTVHSNYKRTSHRYNKLKAKIMGTEKLAAHDEFAPPPGTPESKISWEEAKEIVLEAYHDFSPLMAKHAKEMFDKGYIDAMPRKGKINGAYAMPPCGGVEHPFLLMNFHGTPGDVITLAHELGHNIHQQLVYEAQGMLLDDTPLTLAETASTFGEELVFEKLMKRAKTPAERKALMMDRIEGELGTVDRQVQYAQFEYEVHEKRRNEGALSTEDISAIWRKCLEERAGPNYEIAEGQEHQWARIPHLFNSPFYVSSYAVGDTLAGALFQKARASKAMATSLFEEWKEGNIQDFDKEYIELLKAGGTKHHSNLLKPFGFDMTQPSFWRKGVDQRVKHIEELERFVTEERGQAGLRIHKKANNVLQAVRALNGTAVTEHPDHYLVSVPFTTTPLGYLTHIQDTVAALNAVLGDQVTESRGIITIPRSAERMHDMLKTQLETLAQKTKSEVRTP